jgi:hypothetical protein
MARRAASMLRLERARLISTEPPITHSLDAANQPAPVWVNSPSELKEMSTLATQAKASLVQDNQAIELTGDGSKYGEQLISAPFDIQRNTDYLLTLPVKILRGRMSIMVKSASVTHAAAIVEIEEMKTPADQPERLLRLAFVSGRDERAQLVIANAASQDANPIVRIGAAGLFALGPASNTWTRIPRTLVNALQKLYITAIMLPLSILGLILLARARAFQTLVILLVVPAYYFCVQSATHTEYRYVLSIHYLLFALAAVFMYMTWNYLLRRLRKN